MGKVWNICVVSPYEKDDDASLGGSLSDGGFVICAIVWGLICFKSVFLSSSMISHCIM